MKWHHCLLWKFESIISLRALKLTLNKSMHMSDDEQGINKLWHYEKPRRNKHSVTGQST